MLVCCRRANGIYIYRKVYVNEYNALYVNWYAASTYIAAGIAGLFCVIIKDLKNTMYSFIHQWKSIFSNIYRLAVRRALHF